MFQYSFFLRSVSTKISAPCLPPKIRKRILYHYCVENYVQIYIKQILHYHEADPTVHYETPVCIKFSNIYTQVFVCVYLDDRKSLGQQVWKPLSSYNQHPNLTRTSFLRHNCILSLIKLKPDPNKYQPV